MRIVEIGSGFAPAYIYSKEVKEKLRTGTTYVCIDVDEKVLACEHSAYPVMGDLRRLPLQDNSIDEIWLLNVFGGIVRRSDNHPSGGSTYDCLKELTRALKPNGIIYVGEWYPQARSINKITELDYTDLGLQKEVYKGERFWEFVEQHKFNIQKTWEDTPPFFVSLTNLPRDGPKEYCCNNPK